MHSPGKDRTGHGDIPVLLRYVTKPRAGRADGLEHDIQGIGETNAGEEETRMK